MLSLFKRVSVCAFVLLNSINAHAAVSWDFTGQAERISTATGDSYEWSGSDGSVVTLSAWSAVGYNDIQSSNHIFGRNPWGLVIDQDGYPCGSNSGCSGGDSHYIDNGNVQEFVLFDFGDKEFSLKSFYNGSVGNDSDMTVLAYTGNGDPTQNLSSLNVSELSSNGWGVISHHANTGSGYESANSDLNNVFSSYWIVGTYMSAVGAGGDYIGDCAFDSIKFAGITGEVRKPGPIGSPHTGVPLPGTLALMSLGLVFAVRQRRRKA